MYDNSSEKEVFFTVPANGGMTVKNVRNAPNPLVEYTNFLFYPQEANTGGIDVKILIYNLHGELMKTLETTYLEPGGNTGVIRWDGTDANGRLLNSGLYPYKVMFNGRDGSYSETSQKLMITR
jgi:flagellar hook assembly protein FlgD